MNKLTRRLIAVVAFGGCGYALSCLLVGCGVAGEPREFVIPRSLVTRMLDAHDRARDVGKDGGACFDAAEMVSLAVGLKMTNAQEIASRPRGKMKFCEDKLTDAERFDLWPFEIEKFEAGLEAKMEVSDEVGFRLKPQFAELAGGVVKGGLMQSNQALRWVSQEIECWAVKAMNDEFDRVDEKDFCQMFGVEKMPDDTFAWWVGPACYFIVYRSEGAWEPWAYKFVHYYRGVKPSDIAIFESFPNPKEAVAALRCSYDISAGHNLAALMWNHHCDRLKMNPYLIYNRLVNADCAGIKTAKANLEVLRSHLTELFNDNMPWLRDVSRLTVDEMRKVKILRSGVTSSPVRSEPDSPDEIFCLGDAWVRSNVLRNKDEAEGGVDVRGAIWVDLSNGLANRGVRFVTFALRKELLLDIKEKNQFKSLRDEEEIVHAPVFITPGGKAKASVVFKPLVVDDRTKYCVNFKLEIKQVFGYESEESEWHPKDGLELVNGSLTEPRPGDVVTLKFTNGVEMAFCWCPATTSKDWMLRSGGKDYFVMGCPTNELGAVGDETQHPVTLTKGFWIAQTPITERQYLAAGFKMKDHSFVARDELPVEEAWRDCRDYCARLTGMGRKLHLCFYLPTEAEWEYACRAGTATALNSGKNLTSKFKKCKNLDELGWYTPWISKGRIGPRPVKCFKPNAWGVYDMHGNVPEWCFDEYGPLPSTLEVNPAGPKYGKSHVIRGGDSSSWPACCRSAARGAAVNDEAGFRPIMRRTEHD